jgi:large subunit ribosomal protein L10
MALTKKQKVKIVTGLKEKIAEQNAMFFVSVNKVKVEDLLSLRRDLKAQEGYIQVAKKTLIDLALKDSGYATSVRDLEGEVAIIFALNDQVLPAKSVYNFSKENENIKILGGILEKEFKSIEEIIKLAQLPTKEELLAKIVGSINAPLSGLVNVLQGNLRGLVSVLSQIKN